MPLRDHFHPPLWKKRSWEALHAAWPVYMAAQLTPKLPPGFFAEPRVHLGVNFEIDVCAFDDEDAPRVAVAGGSGGTATLAPPKPTFTATADFSKEYAYEVLVFDEYRERQLVAAVEIVSPGNKDRPSNRRAFVAKCTALLQQRVCVSIVDLVDIRDFNLYTELLNGIDQTDPAFSPAPPSAYAVTCRGRDDELQSVFESWAYPVVVGERLPSLPIWLDEERLVTLDLESSYESACFALGIP